MKRYGYLYEKIIDRENCRQAIIAATSKYTLKEKQKPHIKEIVENVNVYADQLSYLIQNGQFTSPYWEKDICDGLSHKIRHIKIPKLFPDQCAHHAIIQILQPLILKSSHYWSSSNIPGRGQKRAYRGTDQAINRYGYKYCGKMDIKKFYPSINNTKLKQFLLTKIKDPKCIDILFQVIDTNPEGLPIGNYTSPWLAEWYLQQLDHYIIEHLKVTLVRYADDIHIFGNNKRAVHWATRKIIEYCDTILDLTIKSNWQVFRITYEKSNINSQIEPKGRKVDFIGYCFAHKNTTIRKKRSLAIIRQSNLIHRLKAKNRKIKPHICGGIMSRSSAFKASDSYHLKVKYFYSLDRKEIKNVIRKESYRLCGENRNLQLNLVC